eukprot:COSAG01_NODE_14754_length_1413_cov_41.789193_2_plen_167_part_00
MSDTVATATPTAHAKAMNEMIESTNKAEAEANRLKRKYEPDEPEVLMEKILKLGDSNSMAYMRITVNTGAHLVMQCIPKVPQNDRDPSWSFGAGSATQEFRDFGIFETSIGDGHSCHDWLIHFDHKGVRITVVTDHDGNFMGGPDTMTIEECKVAPTTWSWTHNDA